jgi:hypothetical protein
VTTFSIEQAQATWPILIAGLLPDEDLVMREGGAFGWMGAVAGVSKSNGSN